jgi:hypothetical protein
MRGAPVGSGARLTGVVHCDPIGIADGALTLFVQGLAHNTDTAQENARLTTNNQLLDDAKVYQMAFIGKVLEQARAARSRPSWQPKAS